MWQCIVKFLCSPLAKSIAAAALAVVVEELTEGEDE